MEMTSTWEREGRGGGGEGEFRKGENGRHRMVPSDPFSLYSKMWLVVRVIPHLRRLHPSKLAPLRCAHSVAAVHTQLVELRRTAKLIPWRQSARNRIESWNCSRVLIDLEAFNPFLARVLGPLYCPLDLSCLPLPPSHVQHTITPEVQPVWDGSTSRLIPGQQLAAHSRLLNHSAAALLTSFWKSSIPSSLAFLARLTAHFTPPGPTPLYTVP